MKNSVISSFNFFSADTDVWNTGHPVRNNVTARNRVCIITLINVIDKRII